jgi:hypothetical protein
MDPADGPKKRPMAAVRRVGLFRREITESVSPAALEVLLATAGRISEGQLSREGRYYGSTILTIDLEQLGAYVQDRCDAATAARLAAVLEHETELHQAAARLALTEAQRIAGRPLRKVEADVQVRTEGSRVLVDVDVEGVAGAIPAGKRR